MSKETKHLRIREFPIWKMPPKSKIVVIGKPGSGKSKLIVDIAYNFKHVFPIAEIYSGTEDSNHEFAQLFPQIVIYDALDEQRLDDFILRQRIAKSELGEPNDLAMLIVDDCTDKPSTLQHQVFHKLYKNGRHWKMLYILSLQYCMDVKPVIRTNIDGTFILREPSLKNRRALWENYAGIIPDFSMFCQIMDQLTDDYTALYIHNATQSNRLEDCVFWYKAPKDVPRDFRMGCPDFWKFHDERYDTSYVDPIV